MLLEELFKAGRSDWTSGREVAMMLIVALCSQSHTHLLDHAPQLLIFAIEALNDPEAGVASNAWDALSAIISKVRTCSAHFEHKIAIVSDESVWAACFD